MKFSIREIEGTSFIKIRNFKLWKMSELFNSRFPGGWYSLNCDNTELKRSKIFFFCFRTASLGAAGGWSNVKLSYFHCLLAPMQLLWKQCWGWIKVPLEFSCSEASFERHLFGGCRTRAEPSRAGATRVKFVGHATRTRFGQEAFGDGPMLGGVLSPGSNLTCRLGKFGK